MKTETQRLVLRAVLLTALALMPVGRAAAQTFTILRSFGFLTNVTGVWPTSMLVQGGDGALYGTTSGGEGNVIGTVFKVQPDGSGFTVLTRITAGGAGFVSALTLSGSTLYGTKTSGGSSSYGTVFKLNTDGTGFNVLCNFTNFPVWLQPNTEVALSGSTLYGTTSNTDGTGYTVLKSFSGSPDGALPAAGLTLSGSTLYGTTIGGGSIGEGVVFGLNVAPVLNITPIAGAVVLSWDDPTFNLQSGPEVAGPYTNIRGATSSYTNAITGRRQFFRLAMP